MNTKPIPEQVTAEVAKLREMKPTVREFSAFNENNHASIEAQIETLEKELSEDDIYSRNEDYDSDDDEHFEDAAMDAALDALRWKDGDEEMSPSENWEGLVLV